MNLSTSTTQPASTVIPPQLTTVDPHVTDTIQTNGYTHDNIETEKHDQMTDHRVHLMKESMVYRGNEQEILIDIHTENSEQIDKSDQLPNETNQLKNNCEKLDSRLEDKELGSHFAMLKNYLLMAIELERQDHIRSESKTDDLSPKYQTKMPNFTFASHQQQIAASMEAKEHFGTPTNCSTAHDTQDDRVRKGRLSSDEGFVFRNDTEVENLKNRVQELENTVQSLMVEIESRDNEIICILKAKEEKIQQLSRLVESTMSQDSVDNAVNEEWIDQFDYRPKRKQNEKLKPFAQDSSFKSPKRLSSQANIEGRSSLKNSQRQTSISHLTNLNRQMQLNEIENRYTSQASSSDKYRDRLGDSIDIDCGSSIKSTMKNDSEKYNKILLKMKLEDQYSTESNKQLGYYQGSSYGVQGSKPKFFKALSKKSNYSSGLCLLKSKLANSSHSSNNYSLASNSKDRYLPHTEPFSILKKANSPFFHSATASKHLK